MYTLNADIKKLQSSGIYIAEDVPAYEITSFKSGGNIKYIAYPKNIEELCEINDLSRKHFGEFKIIGNLSNTLISDRGFDKILISLKRFKNIKADGNKIYAESGLSLKKINDYAMSYGLSGMENFASIPGSFGGAISMNAGAFNKEIKDVLSKVQVISISGDIKNLSPEELEMFYRSSAVKKNKYIVLSGVLELEESEVAVVKNNTLMLFDKRFSMQPKMPSCGSVFKKNNGQSAGYYIDKLNKKGYSIGDAYVSSVHANFIVNGGRATTSDYLSLAAHLQELLYLNYGIYFEKEVQYIE